MTYGFDNVISDESVKCSHFYLKECSYIVSEQEFE